MDGPIGYCALEYRAHDEDSALANIERVVSIVARSGKEIAIRVHPNWVGIVEAEDLPVIRDLFSDFAERALSDPESLLRQLATLGVGKLVTYSAGKALTACPDLEELFNGFESI